jgi:hypothetical protein
MLISCELHALAALPQAKEAQYYLSDAIRTLLPGSEG